MRYPVTCRIIGQIKNFAENLRDQFADRGVSIVSTSDNLEPRLLEGCSVDVIFLDVEALRDADTHQYAAATRRAMEARPIIVGIGRTEGDVDLLRSYACAIGFDDYLDLEIDELDYRLAAIARLAKTKRDLRLRRELSALYAREGGPRKRRHLSADHRRVLIVGRAGTYQVQIADALPHTRFAYAEGIEIARQMIDAENYDQILVDSDILDNPSRNRSGTADVRNGLFAHSIPTIGLVRSEQGRNNTREIRFDDIISFPTSGAILRLRLDLWLQIARLRQWQCRPNSDQHGLAHDRVFNDLDLDLVFDRLTGLPGYCFSMDLLRIDAELDASKERVIPHASPARTAAIILGIHDFDSASYGSSFAGINRLVANLAKALRQGLRSEDYLGYLGHGRFLIYLPDVPETLITLINKRALDIAQKTVAQAGMPIRHDAIFSEVVELPRGENKTLDALQIAISDWASGSHRLGAGDAATEQRKRNVSAAAIGVPADPHQADVTPPLKQRPNLKLLKNAEPIEAATA